MNDDNVITQYRDPITGERRTVVTCSNHTSRMLSVLRHAKIGCVSTYAPAMAQCEPCANGRAIEEGEGLTPRAGDGRV